MSVPDDLEASLPQPPPPAPARRDAAIRLALDRFDGKDSPPPATTELRAPPWWSRISRPQLGAFATLMLVAAIGIPIAWSSLDRFSGEDLEPAPVTETAARMDAASEKGDEPGLPQPAGTNSAQSELPAAELKAVARPAAEEELAALPPPPPRMEPAEAPQRVYSVPFAKVEQAEPAPPVYSSPIMGNNESRTRAERSAQPAAPPPPIIAPNMADTAGLAQEADAEDRSVIVTGVRRNAKASMRGDWNSCTVNDPQQSLRGCGGLIRGKAAEQIESGLAHAWNGDTQAAIAEFDRAIGAAPRNAFAWLNRGLAHQREGNLDRALADLDQAIRLDPESARAYYNRSIILRQQGESRRAARDAQRAIDIDPQYKDVAR